ncbi:hypothetical protein BBB39_19770 [Bordetella trematum]|uniref:Uncharacterized protein n=1 Tax=Bordetella trematum TaxID=123899 RepID=A0A157MHY2_9BORD|nr:hypothetical protein [Bordetella trematum]AZR95751.1 hypothetical protein BBB39_19770 [Bordetella trematum]NNH18821.1 hypothetical protein [Bordetella trematum]QIM70730.1 hypothetical protein EYB34_04710 [Bordetella trematum]CZZ90471.1 Uncharacterised protein [Bordetella trematum]SAI08603.1 Uncharacterised protein [Bordetella trematum]
MRRSNPAPRTPAPRSARSRRLSWIGIGLALGGPIWGQAFAQNTPSTGIHPVSLPLSFINVATRAALGYDKPLKYLPAYHALRAMPLSNITQEDSPTFTWEFANASAPNTSLIASSPSQAACLSHIKDVVPLAHFPCNPGDPGNYMHVKPYYDGSTVTISPADNPDLCLAPDTPLAPGATQYQVDWEYCIPAGEASPRPTSLWVVAPVLNNNAKPLLIDPVE